ncbi:uncharacterized protein LOC135494826 [Lineus longissimus]|uniref:uncharacterized protein LOC135494826 n=1 Tax=Lineus longissimus TaxID=88925 RepID=UPI002B4ECF21
MIKRAASWSLTVFYLVQRQWPTVVHKRCLHLTTTLFNKDQRIPGQVTSADDNQDYLEIDHTFKSRVQTDTIMLRSVCTRLLSEGASDIKKVAEEICSEIGVSCRIWTSNVEFDVDNIEKKMRNLVNVGCTLNQILENPGVLRYNENEIARRIKKIKALGQPVTTYSILGMHAKSSKYFLKFNGLFRGRSWVEVLSEKLDCSIAELLLDVSPAMSYILCSKYPDRMLEKIDILLEGGFTTFQIRGCLRVLNKDVNTLRKRVADIHELGLQRLMTCSWLMQGEAKFWKIVNNAKRYNQWGDKWEYLSKMLDIPKEELKIHFKRIDMENVIPKIELLIKIGFTGQEILNRPRMLRISEKKIKNVLEGITENEMDHLDTSQRYSWVVNTIPTLHRGVYTQKAVLSKLLNCSTETFTKNAAFLKQALSHPDATILETVSLLKSKGFTISDIEQCPLVLNHEPSILNSYLDGLECRKELQPYAEWEKDKVKLLNVLQYFIERDINFCSTGCMDKRQDSDDVSGSDLLNDLD